MSPELKNAQAYHALQKQQGPDPDGHYLSITIVRAQQGHLADMSERTGAISRG